MLSLHQLTVFLAVYEHGSLTRAAEELGYAQPSISEQVRGLEKSLGVTLFRRFARGRPLFLREALARPPLSPSGRMRY